MLIKGQPTVKTKYKRRIRNKIGQFGRYNNVLIIYVLLLFELLIPKISVTIDQF